MPYVMREIIAEIPQIVSRKKELISLDRLDRDQAVELSQLEAKDSMFGDLCMRYHRINLCQAGFIYGDVLGHPASSSMKVSVRLGDRVIIVEGPDAQDGEMPLIEATRILANRIGRGLAFRDWEKDGMSLGVREDQLSMERAAASPRTAATTTQMVQTAIEAGRREPETPEEKAPAKPLPQRKSRPRNDDLTLDLFA